MNDSTFRSYNDLTDGEIKLVLTAKLPARPDEGCVPQYNFDICLAGDPDPVGSIRLRIGENEPAIRYVGNIGYEIDEDFRGNRYAAKACLLVRNVARNNAMKTLWITVNPDNRSSIRTCEIIGARFVEIIEIPGEFEKFMHGETRMSRYRWDIGPAD